MNGKSVVRAARPEIGFWLCGVLKNHRRWQPFFYGHTATFDAVHGLDEFLLSQPTLVEREMFVVIGRLADAIDFYWWHALGERLNADVFVPEFGAGRDEVAHELDAGGIVEDVDFHTLRADIGFRALESDVLADDDVGDFVKERGAAAHGAGRKCGVEDAARVDGSFLASGVFETVHLGVVDDAAVLDALVVAAANDFAVEDEDGADGDAAGGEAFFGFIDGGLEKWVHGGD